MISPQNCTKPCIKILLMQYGCFWYWECMGKFFVQTNKYVEKWICKNKLAFRKSSLNVTILVAFRPKQIFSPPKTIPCPPKTSPHAPITRQDHVSRWVLCRRAPWSYLAGVDALVEPARLGDAQQGRVVILGVQRQQPGPHVPELIMPRQKVIKVDQQPRWKEAPRVGSSRVATWWNGEGERTKKKIAHVNKDKIK